MRFFYILRSQHGGGVCKKIKGQIQSLKQQGITVVFQEYDNIRESLSEEKNNKILRFPYKNSFVFGIFLKLKREYLVNNALNVLIKISTNDDILYFRFPFPSLMLSKILKRSRKCKIVIEYQSIALLQWRLKGEWLLIINDLIFGGPIRKYADAIVGLTDEITQFELKRSGRPDKKHITIGDGYDVHSVNPRKTPPFNQEELSLLCVAQVDRWHGIDRIIAGIEAYSGPLSVKFHIAGTGAEIPNLKKMVDRKGLTDKVIFHGFVSGIALDNLFDQCHIAIGSIGLHRIGLSEASVLKHREYCARGIPYIIECSDHDFPDDFPYFYTVPADESPISIDDILHFTISVFSDQGHPQKMHDYALKYLDWSIKMKKLIPFLENLT